MSATEVKTAVIPEVISRTEAPLPITVMAQAPVIGKVVPIRKHIISETSPDIPKHRTFTLMIAGSGMIQVPETRIIRLRTHGSMAALAAVSVAIMSTG